MRFDRPSVSGLIELLLGKGRDQQPQTFQLFGIENAVEELVVVGNGHELTLRNIPEVRAGGEVNRRWELGEKMLGKIVIEIESGQVTLFLPHDLIVVKGR